MNSAESLLFQFALSEEFLHLQGKRRFEAKLLRKFVAGYGGAIPSSSLRYAVFSWAAKHLPSPQFESQMEDNKLLCYRALIKRKREVDDADLFATFILALIADNDGERWTHLNGMKSILTSLTSKTPNEGTSFPVFLCFRPFFEAELIQSTPVTENNVLYLDISPSPYTFEDRLACYCELMDFPISDLSSVYGTKGPLLDYCVNSLVSRIMEYLAVMIRIGAQCCIYLKIPCPRGSWNRWCSEVSHALRVSAMEVTSTLNQVRRRMNELQDPEYVSVGKIFGRSGSGQK
jgi:hypothetical protein